MDNAPTSAKPLWIPAVCLILTLLAMRFSMLIVVPLYDTTEARYAEIARIMQETSNWVTPHIDYHRPFWGKPPMHTWMSAASFEMFGVSAFTARLPHFLSGLFVLLLVYRFLRERASRNQAILGSLVLVSSLGFIVAMGMVMTDTALLLSSTIAMVSFWKAFAQKERLFHGHVFFASMALGMLIKGPVAVVLVAIALVSWSLWQGVFGKALRCLPWSSGIALFLALTLPWYLWAEQRSPGFLEYFLVGEHIQRFLEAGWEGDLYGAAHDKPRGTIWLFWLVAAFPWSFVLLKQLLTVLSKGQLKPLQGSNSASLTPYLVGWILSPLMLFSLSGNILIAYVLPGFSAMAVLLGVQGRLNRMSLAFAGLCTAMVACVLAVSQLGWVSKTSEIELLGNKPTQYSSYPLYYWKQVPFSARFYSRGQARRLDNTDDLLASVKRTGGAYLAIKKGQSDQLDIDVATMCSEQDHTAMRTLLFCENKNEVATR